MNAPFPLPRHPRPPHHKAACPEIDMARAVYAQARTRSAQERALVALVYAKAIFMDGVRFAESMR